VNASSEAYFVYVYVAKSTPEGLIQKQRFNVAPMLFQSRVEVFECDIQRIWPEAV